MGMETCSVDGCDRTHYAKKLCRLHWGRLRRTGQVGPAHLIERSDYAPARKAQYSGVGTCACGTEFPQRAIGSPRVYCSSKCKSRYEKRRARENGWTPRRSALPCSVEGCDLFQTAKGFCIMHYERVKKYGEPGEAAPRKAKPGQGVWKVTADGYVRRNRNGVPELQHRVVMEQHIGRALEPHETAHHKNGDRADNRIENLELWSSAQPAGQRVADKLAYAREIIALYGDLPPEAF